MPHGGPPSPSPRSADDGRPESRTRTGPEASIGALVVELSQLELALRRRQLDRGRGHPPTDPDLRALLRRKDAVLVDLRERGLSFDEPVPDTARPGADAVAAGCSQRRGELVARRSAGDARTVADLERALVTRSVIGQAMGMLMERHHLGPDAAFELLTRSSSVCNRRLADVAVELTTTRILPGAHGS